MMMQVLEVEHISEAFRGELAAMSRTSLLAARGMKGSRKASSVVSGGAKRAKLRQSLRRRSVDSVSVDGDSISDLFDYLSADDD